MYKKILVAIDGSDTSQRALDTAMRLAGSEKALLQPLYVASLPIPAYDFAAYDPTGLREAMLEDGKRIVDEASAQIRAAGLEGTGRLLEADAGQDISECILAAAAEGGADLIVLGTHGRRGFQHLLLGSVAERTIRGSTRQVLLVPARVSEPAAT